MTREEIIEALSKLGDNGHNGIDFDEWQAINAAIECLRTDGLWHPASELPVIPEGKFSVSVIAYCNTPSGIYAPVEIAYTRTGGWQYESVKWWCYPPEKHE